LYFTLFGVPRRLHGFDAYLLDNPHDGEDNSKEQSVHPNV